MRLSRFLAAGSSLAQFDLVTVWRIGSGLAEVWEAITRPAGWPLWWPGLEAATELDPGGPDGLRNRQRFVWKGVLPYRLGTEITTVRLDPMRLIEGEASGDVRGVGIWRFAEKTGLVEVRHEWRVRAVKPWLFALAHLARPLVCFNHGRIMEWGAQGLARRLGASVCRVERNPRED